MPIKSKNENTFDYSLRKDERWRQRFPDKRCVEVPNPDKLQGADHNDALMTLNRYRNPEFVGVRYEILDLSEQELINLCDTNMSLLMGADLKEWEALQEMRAGRITPNETEETIY